MRSQFGGYRPGRVEVDDPALAEHLGGLLAEVGIRVDTVERLDAVRRVLDSMITDGFGGGRLIPGLLGDGVTVERMRRFADAAAAFYRAGPWQYLTDMDLIRIEGPKGAARMRCAVVMGNTRSSYGLAFYRTAADYFKFRRAAGADDVESLPASGAWQVTFGPVTQIPLDDADLWEDHGLAVADEQAYPFATWFGPRGALKRPGAAELSYFEAVLWAFAATTEQEIDSGRWTKEVQTHDGPTRVALSLPDLLKPPLPQELIRRGFTPDRRAHERLFAQMEQYFQENQGVRYLLLPRLLELGRDTQAARLLKTTEEESAVWAYARALLAFRLSGRSTADQRELRRAFQTNRYVSDFLLETDLPPTPEHYSPGSPEEAIFCAVELRPAFAATTGALDWLALEHRRRQRAALSRRKSQRKKQRQNRNKRKGH